MKPVFFTRVDRESIRAAVFWRDAAAAGGCSDILSGRAITPAECRLRMRRHAQAWAIRRRPAPILQPYTEAADAA